MNKFQWKRPAHAANAYAFFRTDLRERRDSRRAATTIWPVERRCGWFTVSALRDKDQAGDQADARATLCPFCVRAVRRDWLIDRLRDGVLMVRNVQWPVREAVHRAERWLWGRP